MRAPRPKYSLAFAVVVVSVSLSAADSCQCQYCVDNGTTCLFNYSGSLGDLTHGGNVLFTGNIQLRATFRTTVRAGGTLTVTLGAKIDTYTDLYLIGNISTELSQRASVTSFDGSVYIQSDRSGCANAACRLGQAQAAESLGSILISNSTCTAQHGIDISGSGVSILASKLSVSGSGALTVRANGSVVIQNADGEIKSPLVKIRAGADAVLNTSLPPVDARPGILDLRASGKIDLTSLAQWTLSKAAVFASTVNVRLPLMLAQGGSSCSNRQAWGNVCNMLVDPAAWAGEDLPVVQNLSYDVLISAQQSLQIAGKTEASSLLLCSGGDMSLEGDASLDVSGRGCGVGLGAGTAGDVPLKCGTGGAGGGSHVASGGLGGTFDSDRVSTCAPPGNPDDSPPWGTPLPTSGASGGGCPHRLCLETRKIGEASAGGGLIWLSASNKITVESGVCVLANGLPGVGKPLKDGTTATGGGSGGQIILFASSLELPHVTDTVPCSTSGPCMFCARGGDIGCARGIGQGAVGGGGGGGFIGFQTTIMNNTSAKIDVDGGRSGAACTDIPTSGQKQSYGTTGVAVSLLGCQAGHYGILCHLCPNATWSYANSSSCWPCKNKPAGPNAFYPWDAVGNAGQDCRYECAPGFADVRANPKCLNNLALLLDFYGGEAGIALIILSLVLFSMYSLRRRGCPLLADTCRWEARTNGRILSNSLNDERHGVWGTLRSLVCKCCGPSEEHGNGQVPSSDFHFPRYYLPYHACRVYMHGQNRPRYTWSLPDAMPSTVRNLLSTADWNDLVDLVRQETAVSRLEAYGDIALRWIYPPMAPVLARWCRRRRGRRLERSVGNWCNEHGFYQTPPPHSSARPRTVAGVMMGCDRSATLGYIDIFDYSKSQLDWAVDFQREIWLLPAVGYGTHDEPIAIDSGDPLIWHLAYTVSSALAMSSVISTFNQISRTLCLDELVGKRADEDSVALQVLADAVQQCAERCGLRGLVTVATLMQTSKQSQCLPNRQLRQLSFTDFVSPRGSAAWRLAQRAVGFTSPGNTESGSNADNTASVGAPQQNEPVETQKGYFRLCLAFGSASLLPPTLGRTDGAVRTHGSLTAPIDASTLEQLLLEGALQASASPVIGDYSPLDSLRRLVIRLCRPLQADAVCKNRCSRWDTPWGVHLAVIVTMFADALAFGLWFGILAKVGSGQIYLWLPPVVEPLQFLAGAVALLFDYPFMGELFASLAIFSLLSVVVGASAMLGASLLWCPFIFVQVALRLGLKLMLFVAASTHFANIEAIKDRAYLGVGEQQAEFVTGIVAEASPRLRASFARQLSQTEGSDRLMMRVSDSSDGMLPLGTPEARSVEWRTSGRRFEPSPF